MGTARRFGQYAAAAADRGFRCQRCVACPVRQAVWILGHGGLGRRHRLALEPLGSHRHRRRLRRILVRHAFRRLARRMDQRRRVWRGWRAWGFWRWVRRTRRRRRLRRGRRFQWWWRRIQWRRRLGKLVMQIGRLLRHATATHWRTRMLFPSATLDAIEQAIARAELTHAGEIRFAVETALTPNHILNDLTPRAHALE